MRHNINQKFKDIFKSNIVENTILFTKYNIVATKIK